MYGNITTAALTFYRMRPCSMCKMLNPGVMKMPAQVAQVVRGLGSSPGNGLGIGSRESTSPVAQWDCMNDDEL